MSSDPLFARGLYQSLAASRSQAHCQGRALAVPCQRTVQGSVVRKLLRQQLVPGQQPQTFNGACIACRFSIVSSAHTAIEESAMAHVRYRKVCKKYTLAHGNGFLYSNLAESLEVCAHPPTGLDEG